MEQDGDSKEQIAQPIIQKAPANDDTKMSTA